MLLPSCFFNEPRFLLWVWSPILDTVSCQLSWTNSAEVLRKLSFTTKLKIRESYILPQEMELFVSDINLPGKHVRLFAMSKITARKKDCWIMQEHFFLKQLSRRENITNNHIYSRKTADFDTGILKKKVYLSSSAM